MSNYLNIANAGEHKRYFGEVSPAAAEWKGAYTRIVDLVDRLSPNWRTRSEFVGDALHQEIAHVFPLVQRAEKDKAVLEARNRVAEAESNLQRAKELLFKAEHS